MVVSIENAQHYKWGDNCDGWHLHATDALSVIQEKMPAGTSEKYHLHENARQIFFILSGTASFEMDGRMYTLNPVDSIHVPANTPHKIINSSANDLHFLVISQPRVKEDRVNIK
jgi:mannose-6-phosphate isomerase-like protein (cupin superfamily)